MELKKYVASVSFGKDSLAMLLMLLEKEYPLDEVVFYDTGMEFPCVYEIKNEIKTILQDKNIKFTELKPDLDFEYKMFEKEVKKKDGSIGKGYGWCGGKCRWGTKDKVLRIRKHLKYSCPYGRYEYVGIAADEIHRIDKKQNEGKLMPLVEWGMTEKDCLEYCHSKGYYWNHNGIELYDVLKRVSCWCCANKNLKELRAYYDFFPEYWEKLKVMQDKTELPFYNNKETIFDIEKRFTKEV